MTEFPHRSIHLRQRNLPHWTTDGGTYFVTFRLIDAMSQNLAIRIAARKSAHKLADRFLDRSLGRCWLKETRIAKLVDDAIRFFDEKRYLLHAWTIMPNHVHVAMRLLGGIRLDCVLHSWKSFTSNAANELLGRSGCFWQDESYDSLLHDQHDLDRVIDYIVRNPIRVGLSERWTTVLRSEFSF